MDEPDDPQEGRPLSQLLRELCAEAGELVAVERIMSQFGRRAFGAVLFVFSAPNLLPLPPGASTVLGAPLMLIAPQVAWGVKHPWLPRRVRARTISGPALSAAFARLLPWLERIERVSRPRLPFLFGPVGDRLIGMVCTVLALVLILPVPFGNMLPAAAIGVLALALVLHDGLLALAGYVLAAASVGVLAIAAHVIVAGFDHLLRMIGAA